MLKRTRAFVVVGKLAFFAALLTVGVAAALMTGCSREPESGFPLSTAKIGTQADLAQPAQALMRERTLQALSRAITVDEFFNWAEATYPELFPSRQQTVIWQPYQYRYYPETNVYVGVANGEVFLLGKVMTGGALVRVGSLHLQEQPLAASGDIFARALARQSGSTDNEPSATQPQPHKDGDPFKAYLERHTSR